MRNPGLIGPIPGTTPADLRLSRGQPRAIPDDLLRDASKRLGVLSLLGAVLWVLGPGLGHVASAVVDPESRFMAFGVLDVIAGVSVVLSLALFAYSRRRDTDPAFVLDLGLVYMVYVALATGTAFHWGFVRSTASVQPEISWAGAVMLMFAAIAPNSPRKVLVAALIAASMNPVSMLIARARGMWEFDSVATVFAMHYPDYLLAGVAVLISHVVMTLGQQVTKAREMGSYRLGKLLGRGGMGEVYMATHHMLARPAAIKLIRPEMLAADAGESAQLALTRFRREAEAAASLQSPHTVQLYDFGVTEDGTFYFVMELLDGLDLETLVRRFGPMPANRVIHIIRQVCESLDEAHARGLVHRDIKPENIHLGRFGLRHDFVKVLDFGLVKAAVGRNDGASLETAAGLTPGTPAYMAPELALGDAIDGRADIYALGCVAYYLLTAELVFRADNVLQMIARHQQSEPAPPSRRAEYPVPGALDKLILACLAKDPAERPRTAAALGASLAAVDVDPWDEEQALRWWEANRPPGDGAATAPEVSLGMVAVRPSPGAG